MTFEVTEMNDYDKVRGLEKLIRKNGHRGSNELQFLIATYLSLGGPVWEYFCRVIPDGTITSTDLAGEILNDFRSTLHDSRCYNIISEKVILPHMRLLANNPTELVNSHAIFMESHARYDHGGRFASTLFGVCHDVLLNTLRKKISTLTHWSYPVGNDFDSSMQFQLTSEDEDRLIWLVNIVHIRGRKNGWNKAFNFAKELWVNGLINREAVDRYRVREEEPKICGDYEEYREETLNILSLVESNSIGASDVLAAFHAQQNNKLLDKETGA